MGQGQAIVARDQFSCVFGERRGLSSATQDEQRQALARKSLHSEDEESTRVALEALKEQGFDPDPSPSLLRLYGDLPLALVERWIALNSDKMSRRTTESGAQPYDRRHRVRQLPSTIGGFSLHLTDPGGETTRCAIDLTAARPAPRGAWQEAGSPYRFLENTYYLCRECAAHASEYSECSELSPLPAFDDPKLVREFKAQAVLGLEHAFITDPALSERPLRAREVANWETRKAYFKVLKTQIRRPWLPGRRQFLRTPLSKTVIKT
jgi:hypothetical protein